MRISRRIKREKTDKDRHTDGAKANALKWLRHLFSLSYNGGNSKDAARVNFVSDLVLVLVLE